MDDIIGQRFGSRVVVSVQLAVRGDRRRPVATCRCDCGDIGAVDVHTLRAGRSQCCARCRRGAKHPTRTHGLSTRKSAEYNAWAAMQQRCAGTTNRAHLYAGVKIAERWCGPDGLVNFIQDVGPRPSRHHSLDRYPNNDGNYEPGNVRWATAKEQARNRRNASSMTAHGVTKLQVEWAEELGIRYHALRKRLRLGWTPEEVVAGRRDVPPSRDNRRGFKHYDFRGESKTLDAWAKLHGLSAGTVRMRLKLGWSLEDALTKPVAGTAERIAQ